MWTNSKNQTFNVLVDVVSKVKISKIQLSNCKFSFISPLQTSPEGTALKSPSGDLGALTVSDFQIVSFWKNIITFDTASCHLNVEILKQVQDDVTS